MASLEISRGISLSVRILTNLRRFTRWLASPHIILSLIMLILMFIMVIIPLYQLVSTTLVWGPTDVPQHPEAVEGELTIYHYLRMLSGRLAKIYTYIPLQHSMTVAIGSTLLALAIGGG